MRATLLVAALALALACGGEASEPSGVSEDQQVDAVYSLGERVEIDGYPDIVVESLERSQDPASVRDRSGPGGFSHVLDGTNEFIIVSFRVINDTDAPAKVSWFTDLSLLSQGTSLSGAATYLVSLWDEPDEVLPPRTEVDGRVAWALTLGFDDLALRYTPGPLDGPTAVVALE